MYIYCYCYDVFTQICQLATVVRSLAFIFAHKQIDTHNRALHWWSTEIKTKIKRPPVHSHWESLSSLFFFHVLFHILFFGIPCAVWLLCFLFSFSLFLFSVRYCWDLFVICFIICNLAFLLSFQYRIHLF